MKTPLVITTLFFGSMATITVAAQTRPRYVFDNFASGSVKVETVSVTPGKNPKAKKLVKKTVQSAPVMPQSFKAKSSLASNRSMRGFSTGDAEIDGYIIDSCRRYGVDPLLIYAQMNQESSFKLRATSNKGARGLMQLMPATAARFGVTDIYDPQQNIEGGVKYMRFLLDTFSGDVSLALAGYNAGEGAVMKYGGEIPPYNETQNYVRRITARYASFRGGYMPMATTGAQSEMQLPNTPKAISSQTTTLEVKKAGSINIDEKAVFAIKTRDGKTQLVSQ
jgi:Transglycosylase SLT domain